MSLSFKKFHGFMASATQSDDVFLEFLEEGFFKTDDEKVGEYEKLLSNKDFRVRKEAERGLSLLVKKGNNKAKILASQHEKNRVQNDSVNNAKMQRAQAVNQADDDGSSRAWRNETGSAPTRRKGGMMMNNNHQSMGGFH